MNIFKKPSPKATKRFLATLLCGSLILGTSGVNAVSVKFEELEQNDETLELKQSDEIEQDDIAVVYDNLESENIKNSNIDSMATENHSVIDIKKDVQCVLIEKHFMNV